MFVALGVTPGSISLSTTEYISRGADVIVPFATLVVIPALGLAAAHHLFVRPALAKPAYERFHRLRRWGLVALAGCGCACLTATFIGVFFRESLGQPLRDLLPFALTVGAVSLAYSFRISTKEFDSVAKLITTTLTCLTLLGIVWMSIIYGQYEGRRFARHFAETVSQQAEIIIWARTDLHIASTSVPATKLSPDGDGYQYCYSGLRLLMSSGDQYVFVPAGWRPGTTLHIVLKQDFRFDSSRAVPGQTLTCAS